MARRVAFCRAGVVSGVRQARFAAVIGLLLAGLGDAENPVELKRLTQMLSQARVEAQQVKDETSRLVLLQNLAAAEARAGNLQTAASEVERLEPIVKSTPHYGDCNYIYVEIIRAQVRAGDYDAAYRTIERILRSKDEAYYALAEEMARKGDLDQALAVVEQTTRPENLRRRAQVVLGLAVAAVMVGDSNRATLLFDQAERLSVQLLHEAGVKAGTIELALNVAAKRYACGNAEAAFRIFSESKSLIDGIADDSRRQQYLSALASASAEAGDFDLAHQVAIQITDPMRSAQTGAALVRAYLSDGEDTDAAFGAASTISYLGERCGSLTLVASAQARKGQKQQAISTIETVQKLLQYSSDDFKPWGKLNLAAAHYELGRTARAAQLCDEAIMLTRRFTIHPDRERSLLFRNAARLRASFGDEAGALSTARRSGDPPLFEDVAQAEAEAGLADNAVKWIANLRDHEQKARALLVLFGECWSGNRTPWLRIALTHAANERVHINLAGC